MRASDRGILHRLYLYYIPFRHFRNAAEGNFLVREQNYRYNREQRQLLPGYLFKWAVLGAVLLASAELAHAFGRAFPSARQLLLMWEMASGVGFAVAVALMSNIAAGWAYLTYMR
ncbi:hypothetical protein [Crenobacter luteus]|uniref:Uncharacterized protein n=1 Tax=Crenobacter luteus TaxID=1452487 RepID=A0A165G2I8_9NEIS|nr:hypothetical protein [Crenobacter luteus]KZE34939.1 hypothetical protein AVW16_05515 [Crenobacter luteus]